MLSSARNKEHRGLNEKCNSNEGIDFLLQCGPSPVTPNHEDSGAGTGEEAILTRYVNTTPHAITIMADESLGGGSITIDTSDVSIRVKSETTCDEVTFVGPLLVEIRKRKFTSVTYSEGGVEMPLPAEQEGVLYIVSRITAEALPGRSDLLMVDGTVRDDDGRIIGCTGFSRLQ